MEAKGSEPEDLVLLYRNAVAQTVSHNTNSSALIHQLLYVDKPHAEKFAHLNFPDLVANNSQNSESLKKLVMGLNILEKYGRHLLKPAESRSNMWRHIKFTNSIFRDRVDNIQGGRDIMALLGYSVVKNDGVAFPDGVDPNHEQILDLVVDILLAKKEIEAYLTDTHPHKNHFDAYVCPKVLPTTDVLESGGSGEEASKDQKQVSAQSSKQLTSGSTENQSSFVTANECKSTDNESSENRSSSITCDICGKKQPDFVCDICDGKRLCRDCDRTWHKHPKRQNHQRVPMGSVHLDDSPPPPPCRNRTENSQSNAYLTPEGNQQMKPREPMSLYPSQTEHPIYANFGSSLPAVAKINQSPRPGTPQGFGEAGQPMPITNQQWTGLHPGSSGSMPRLSGSPLGASGGLQSLTGSRMSSPDALSSMAGAYQQGSSPVQSGTQVNVVNPLQFSQPGNMRFPAGEMQHSKGYGTGLTAGQNVNSMQQYPSNFMPNSMAMFGSQESARYMYPTLPPQTLGRYSVGSGTPQSQGRGMERPYSPKTPEILQTPSTGSGTSMSQLLPNIMAIPNLEKRMSRIRIDLMSLQEDIKDWDTRINAIILDNPNFFQDEDYKSLNRKKRRHLQEIKELEAYNHELEAMLENDAIEKEKRKSQEDEQIEMLRQRLSQIQSEDPYMVMHQIPPYVVPGGAPATSSGMYNPYMPHIPVTANQNPQISSSHMQIPPNNRPLHTPSASANTNASDKSKDLPDDIKRMLCLDQNPHAFNSNLNLDQKALNISTQISSSQDVTYPPQFTANQLQGSSSNDIVRPKSSNNIAYEPAAQNQNTSASAIKQRQSEPNLAAKVKSPSKFDAHRSQSDTNMTMWECEHCTYQNDASNKACAICYKTSENPKVIGPMGAQINKDRQEEEACEFCTYRNKKGTQICEMCARTQTRYAVNEEVVETQGNVGIEQEAELTAGCPHPPGEEGVANTSSVGKLIDDMQDKVYLEKKAAQEKFDKTMDETTSSTASASAAHVFSPPIRPGPKLPQAASAPGNQLAPNRDVQKIVKSSENDQSSSSTSGSYISAQNSLETSGNQSATPEKPNDPKQSISPTVRSMEQQGLVKKGRPQLDFAEAIEQISLKRDQEQMSLDALDFVHIIREAEMAGYDIRETTIAQRQSVQEKVKTLDWLKDKWTKMIEEVARKAAEEGAKANQNDIGDLSAVEAKEALIQSDGDVEKATRVCVQERAKKYKEISGQENFAREDILTALYQRNGNVDEARDQLNQAVVQGYIDRLWTEEEGEIEERGDAALASAARSPDQNNSVCNSTISHEDFLRNIKDTQINRERRMRMVLVEGKLPSWGRADIVITILDTEVTNAETPLECTLEDIIEAVRNCGDRKSSLFYLKQQCDVCYALYPMSKIGNLASCDCKLCHDCIKQNFEVVIREKYVRNWGCPICSKPDFEDNTEASSYFEFLSLILSTRVSPELMELFEIKLRDWHLQKDKNFRWCAHCASGFIWDRPDVLGMTCPHCRKKTCFMCKKKWEEQHEGLTCEEFTQWCIDNDPQAQAKGVQVYLEKNGIDCPSCKMRYDLAKGGCMHFKCPQCGHEFCSGCYQAFLKDGLCKMFKSCARKGLHCHHPRDCFYWLRDYSSQDLQRLLKGHKVHYNTEPPDIQIDKLHCPVMEQKEYDAQKKDEPCNSDTKKGMAGLCESHYKEYLVGLINKNSIDPVSVMSQKDMTILINRHEREVPELQPTEDEAAYRKRLMLFIKENFKIPKK